MNNRFIKLTINGDPAVLKAFGTEHLNGMTYSLFSSLAHPSVRLRRRGNALAVRFTKSISLQTGISPGVRTR